MPSIQLEFPQFPNEPRTPGVRGFQTPQVRTIWDVCRSSLNTHALTDVCYSKNMKLAHMDKELPFFVASPDRWYGISATYINSHPSLMITFEDEALREIPRSVSLSTDRLYPLFRLDEEIVTHTPPNVTIMTAAENHGKHSFFTGEAITWMVRFVLYQYGRGAECLEWREARAGMEPLGGL